MEKEFAAMVSELIYRQYFLNRGQLQEMFEMIDLEEFIALKYISRREQEKVYIKDLSTNLKTSNQKVTTTIGKLRDKGLIKWTYDGDGEEGTYVTITEEGFTFLNSQERMFIEHFSVVIEKFGVHRMGKFLAMFKDLQKIVREEFKKEDSNGSKPD